VSSPLTALRVRFTRQRGRTRLKLRNRDQDFSYQNQYKTKTRVHECWHTDSKPVFRNFSSHFSVFGLHVCCFVSFFSFYDSLIFALSHFFLIARTLCIFEYIRQYKWPSGPSVLDLRLVNKQLLMSPLNNKTIVRGRLSVAGGDGSRSCRSSEGATPLLDKLGYIELNWDESPGRGHVTTGACRWMIVAERGQRINLTLYHFGAQSSSSIHSRCEPVLHSSGKLRRGASGRVALKNLEIYFCLLKNLSAYSDTKLSRLTRHCSANSRCLILPYGLLTFSSLLFFTNVEKIFTFKNMNLTTRGC